MAKNGETLPIFGRSFWECRVPLHLLANYTIYARSWSFVHYARHERERIRDISPPPMRCKLLVQELEMIQHGCEKGSKVPLFSHGRDKLINPIVGFILTHLIRIPYWSYRMTIPLKHVTLDPKVGGITATVGSIRGCLTSRGPIYQQEWSVLASGNSGYPPENVH